MELIFGGVRGSIYNYSTHQGQFRYDSRNNIIYTTDDIGNTVRNIYDLLDHPVAVAEENLNSTGQVYDTTL